ncbi:hypothetical protein GALL_07500 [mine drainage metagenome]|uniref:Uncharacterized protein n=1 Tax=mine drainage metagenome TaxID=410659 RepID=A0A1J5TFV7_9ZZZZ
MIQLQHLPSILLGAYCSSAPLQQGQDFLFDARTLQPEENVMKPENTRTIASSPESNPDYSSID